MLGVRWLEVGGSSARGNHNLTITFVHMGQPITLNADAPPIPSAASIHKLKRLAQTQSISALFHISTTPVLPSPPSPSLSIPPQITSVLDKYPLIFAEPTHLPPSPNHSDQRPSLQISAFSEGRN